MQTNSLWRSFARRDRFLEIFDDIVRKNIVQRSTGSVRSFINETRKSKGRLISGGLITRIVTFRWEYNRGLINEREGGGGVGLGGLQPEFYCNPSTMNTYLIAPSQCIPVWVACSSNTSLYTRTTLSKSNAPSLKRKHINSDHHTVSSHIINTLTSKQVMRITKIIIWHDSFHSGNRNWLGGCL